MADKTNSLESYIVSKLLPYDPNARRTRGSGSHTELGDVYNTHFFVECKIKRTKTNIIMDRKEDFMKLAEKIPVHSFKEMFVAIENKFGEKYIIMDSEAFFRLVEKAYEDEL